MHPVPRRHRESRQIDERAALGRAAIAGIDASHERRLDLRPGPGGDEPGQAGAEAFSRGSDVMSTENVVQVPADMLLVEELAGEDVVEMAKTTAQTGISGTIFISTAMGGHGPRVKYLLQPGRTQPSFSVSIADAPAVAANSL